MSDFSQLLQQGTANAWLFVPSAILLGALHGLEPGHSKTMMAAFIVAVRGTVAQAILLGVSATISHTAIVWVIALAGMYYFGGSPNSEATEPYFQLASAVLIIGVAAWMLWNMWKRKASKRDACAHDHGHAHHVPTPRNVTTGQIIAFGLTGGLVPCPAAITVLLLCLQLRQFALGVTLVLCFSVGLALTMMASGVAAALSVKHVSKRWSGFGEFARKAPYFSIVLVLLVGVYVGYHGLAALR